MQEQPRSGQIVSQQRKRFVATWCVLSVLAYSTVARSQDGPLLVMLLGTGSPSPSMDRCGPSTLVQAAGQSLLFDVGRGAHQRLAQAGLNAAQVDAVFITHLHSDHFVGVPDLWLTGWLTTSRSKPWAVFGPQGTAAMFAKLREAFSVDLQTRVVENAGHLPIEGGEVIAKDIDTGVVYDRGGVRVTAIKVDHRAIAPAYGYRVDVGRRSVVLSGDTTVSPELAKAAMGTDLLIHEVYDVSDDVLKQNARQALVATFHVNAEQAGRLFQQAQPKLAAYSHVVLRGVGLADLVRRTRMTYKGPLVVGEDLTQFVVDEAVAVTRP